MTADFPIRRIIVCGSRLGLPWLLPRALVSEALDAWCRQQLTPLQFDALHVIAGSRKGIDGLALQWAEARELIATCCSAKWMAQGKSAGPRRNRRMLDVFEPDAVLAFPGGDGTEDMITATYERVALQQSAFDFARPADAPRSQLLQLWKCEFGVDDAARFEWKRHA